MQADAAAARPFGRVQPRGENHRPVSQSNARHSTHQPSIRQSLEPRKRAPTRATQSPGAEGVTTQSRQGLHVSALIGAVGGQLWPSVCKTAHRRGRPPGPADAARQIVGGQAPETPSLRSEPFKRLKSMNETRGRCQDLYRNTRPDEHPYEDLIDSLIIFSGARIPLFMSIISLLLAAFHSCNQTGSTKHTPPRTRMRVCGLMPAVPAMCNPCEAG